MICWTCHRTLKNAPVMIGGHPFGPKCAKSAKPIPAVERDLFGFDVERAVAVATERLGFFITGLAMNARHAMQWEFAAARKRLGLGRP